MKEEINEMIEALIKLKSKIEQKERNVDHCNSTIDHINSGCEVPISLNDWNIWDPKKVRKVMEVLRDSELADYVYLREFQKDLRVSVKLSTINNGEVDLSVQDILEYIGRVL